MTGYFSANALALAARGIEHLIANGGRMRLIVGCTLDKDEIQAIDEGYDLRQKIAEKLEIVPLDPPNPEARRGLESLAWMVAQKFLDVMVAVPAGPDGKPAHAAPASTTKRSVSSPTDSEENRLSFGGSINAAARWLEVNRAGSFHVHCSWAGDRETQHVADEVAAFDRLWNKQSPSTLVYDFPEAALRRLLDFLPKV